MITHVAASVAIGHDRGSKDGSHPTTGRKQPQFDGSELPLQPAACVFVLFLFVAGDAGLR
jgi:hypothetical protein